MDWFRVDLEAGKTYQFDLEGVDTGRGTVPDPEMALYDSSDNLIRYNDDNPTNLNSRIIYPATASGAYYLGASDANEDSGTYTLSVTEVETRSTEGDTDLRGSIFTLGRVEVGGSATGNIESATDVDYFRVDLEAGKTYQFEVEGAGTGQGTLDDSSLDLYDEIGDLAPGSGFTDRDNDLGNRFTYSVTTAGIYYVAASGLNQGTGTYTLSVRDITQPPPCTLNTGDIWCGVVTVGELRPSADALVGHGFADSTSLSAGGLAGYPDDTMFSVGDNDYTISGAYIQVPTADHLTGTLFVVLDKDLTDDDKAGLVLTVDGTTTTFAFSDASKGGTTGLYSWGPSGLSWSAGDTVTIRVRPRTLSVADASDAENDGEVEFTVTLSAAAATTVTATRRSRRTSGRRRRGWPPEVVGEC